MRGVSLVADPAGAIFWPDQRMLIVSDLHLEKGSSFARRGSLLPPYDTPDTLGRLTQLVSRYAPHTVVALGDNFHDGGGASRLAPEDRASILRLQSGRDWVWITGNHDPDPQEDVGGAYAETISIGPLTFRHTTTRKGGGEVTGHLHPVAIVLAGGRALRRRCFACDGNRMVMPAFGAYAGGLNIRHRAFQKVFAGGFTAHVIGNNRVHAFAAEKCLG